MTAGAPLLVDGYSLSSNFILPFFHSDFKSFSPFLSISYTKAACSGVTSDGSDDGDGGNDRDDGDDAPFPSCLIRRKETSRGGHNRKTGVRTAVQLMTAQQ